ncbi:MAG: Aconitate hydratase A [Alphaproteobacteria bacterium MarineAlpha9_Bin2]|nr:MAG: Aconitate hydratase A [Alphaproteobacteria bacterium MarineAlpha9_Bin2]
MEEVNSSNFKDSIKIKGKEYDYYSLNKASELFGHIDNLPYSIKVIVENLLRNLDRKDIDTRQIDALINSSKNSSADVDIFYRPARVLMQDFTGVPAVVDLAAMRQAVSDFGISPSSINPLSPVDLVIDHSVSVDRAGSKEAFNSNVKIEFERNKERYSFLKWGQQAFKNFRVVPPGTGICHQVNLEYLSKVIWISEDNEKNMLFPDTLVGTDSHTTMVNGLAVLGWGVGGIEAEAVMLGQSISMKIPEVVGVKLYGSLNEGVTATDLVLTITELLRKKGVVGKFVEFFGSGLDELGIADRATIANMAPEYGATCGFFPIDKETCRYLEFTGRDYKHVEVYAKAQGMWRDSTTKDLLYKDILELNLSDVESSMSGPIRPQDRVKLNLVSDVTKKFIGNNLGSRDKNTILNGDVAIAAITSCTNTSNPSVMIAAGLLAKNAVELGLEKKPWVKTSLAPGSKVVSDYLSSSGLLEPLEKLGFYIVGYGCTTCIGNSGPLDEEIESAIQENNLLVCSVLSGNRNFEGRINPFIKANWLASPPLVVAYSIFGTLAKDITTSPIGFGKDKKPIYLSDLWPNNNEINEVLKLCLKKEMFTRRYKDIFEGTPEWKDIKAGVGITYNWDPTSTYVRYPPYFKNMQKDVKPLEDIIEARSLAIFGDSITTDHISPAGVIKKTSPAGKYLTDRQISENNFNSYGSRRGNHEIMIRGTFGNIRIRNKMVPEVEGGFTTRAPDENVLSIYDASLEYQKNKIPLIIIAGKEYGTGSSRDWAAKGTYLLGVKLVLAESFERIHRSNLIGMGVLPVEFKNEESAEKFNLKGKEKFSLRNIENALSPGCELELDVEYPDKSFSKINVLCRIDTKSELEYYRNGGILHYVLRNLINN